MARAFPFRTRDGREGVVREARPADARTLLATMREVVRERPRTLTVLEDEVWTPRAWRRHRADWGPDAVTLVAEVEGEVVGELSCLRARGARFRHVAEFGMSVSARARGIGVGRALLLTLEGWAREFGIERIELSVFPWNERARRLYESLGYAVEGVRRGAVRFPEGDGDLVQMAKALDGATPRAATMSAPQREKGEGDG